MAERASERIRVFHAAADTVAPGASGNTGWVALPQAYRFLIHAFVESSDTDVAFTLEVAKDNTGTGAKTLSTYTTGAAATGVFTFDFDSLDLATDYGYVRLSYAATGGTTGATLSIIAEGVDYAYSPASGIDTVTTA